MTQRHKVFVSYHHDNDQAYRDKFEKLFAAKHEIFVPKSVQIGDIDPYLPPETIRQKIRDQYLQESTVTVVLIGSQTWQRKHVDWEIGSSIRETKYNSRSGLIGILLPSYTKPNPGEYNQYTIPPRLNDNIKCKFAEIYDWNTNPDVVQRWIHDAFLRRSKVIPDNSYPSFSKNRSGARWS
mgnify:CR=1 FL=1